MRCCVMRIPTLRWWGTDDGPQSRCGNAGNELRAARIMHTFTYGTSSRLLLMYYDDAIIRN